MSFKIFETGMYDYSDDPRVNVSKPVLYTPKFFEEMVKEIGDVPLDTKHDGKSIGSLSNISFKDNCLYADANTEQEFKGISPVFRYDTIDKGGYLEAVNGEFTSAGITDTPRSNIIYNSYPNDNNQKNGSENMVSEEAFEQITKQNRKLERELATAENQLEANKEKLKRLSELESEIKNLEAENKKYNDELEKVRPLAKKYSEYENNKRESLIEEVANGDAGFKEKIKDMDIETLEIFKENRIVDTEPTGVDINHAEGQGEGNGEQKKTDDGKPSFEEVDAFYTTLYGEE